MRKNIAFIVNILFLFASCSKSGGGASTTTVTLNATEKLLVGHWQLKKVTDSSGYKTGGTFTPTIKSETKYTVTDFIELNNKKEWAKNLEEKIKDARIGGAGAALGGTNSPTTGIVQDFIGWYYDEGVSKLVLSSVSYDVLSVSSTELVLWRNTIAGTYYTSYTATYSK